MIGLFLLVSGLLPVWAADKPCRPVAKMETSASGTVRVPRNFRDFEAIDFPARTIRGPEFAWYGACEDGSYYLRATPEQLILYNGHNNPNPSFVFWATDITPEQFQAIRKIARMRKSRHFDCLKESCTFKAPFHQRMEIKHAKWLKAAQKNHELPAPEDDCTDSQAVLEKNVRKLLSVLKIEPAEEVKLDRSVWIRELGSGMLQRADLPPPAPWCD